MRKPGGFSLIELMAVVVIMAFIMALSATGVVYYFAKAKKEKAISQVLRLESALENFKNDMGYYPIAITSGEYFGDTSSEKNQRKLMLQALSGFDKDKNKITTYWNDTDWHGPYLEFKSNEIDSSGQMIDPWRQAYLVDATASGRAMKNPSSIDILSKGPDKQWDYNNYSDPKNDDNICNWLGNYVKDME